LQSRSPRYALGFETTRGGHSPGSGLRPPWSNPLRDVKLYLPEPIFNLGFTGF